MPARRSAPPTDGPYVREWMTRAVRFTDGHRGGEPFECEPWQAAFLDDAFELDPVTGRRVYQQAVLATPKKNGKTQLAAALALYGLSADGCDGELEMNPQVPIAAAARKQAAELGMTARQMALASPSLRRRLRVMQHDIHAKRGGRLWWVASDADTIHGIKPSFSVTDELGSHKNEYVYTTILQSSINRVQPLHLTISHVGVERYGVFGTMYDTIRSHPKLEVYGGKGKNGRLKKEPALMILRDREAGFLMYWYGIGDRDDLDPEDPRVWEASNPASWVERDALERLYLSPAILDSNFRRWHCNQWVIGADAFLPAGAWQACGDEEMAIPAGADVFVGLDGAKKHDYGALAVCWPQVIPGEQEPVFNLTTRMYRAEDSATSIVGRLGNQVRRTAGRFTLHEAHYDPHFLTETADALEDEGIDMLEFAQTPGRMGIATKRFRELVLSGRIRHDGDPELAKHVANAVTVEAGENLWRVSKGKSREKIDGLVAALMAVDAAYNAWRRGDVGPGSGVQIIG
jgi:phage terminase large subunit-like protein